MSFLSSEFKFHLLLLTLLKCLWPLAKHWQRPHVVLFPHSIFLDPKYGTFVFHTVEGQSKCPNEKGTRPVEEPSLTVSRSHGPGPIIPDDTLMTFTLELANTGYGGSTFYLYHDTSTNPGERLTLIVKSSNGLCNWPTFIFFNITLDGLGIDLFAPETGTWELPSTQHGGTVMTTTITIEKGPKPFQNIYPAIKLYLQVRWLYISDLYLITKLKTSFFDRAVLCSGVSQNVNLKVGLHNFYICFIVKWLIVLNTTSTLD